MSGPTRAAPLSGWSGSALAKKNLGATYAEGTVLCTVGDPQHFEAVMLVDQTEVEFVERGHLKLNAFPFETFTGKVDEIAETHIEVGSERLIVKAGGSIPTTTDEMGREVPTQVDDPDNLLTPGMWVAAGIVGGTRKVGQWIWRLFWQTFNFKMYLASPHEQCVGHGRTDGEPNRFSQFFQSAFAVLGRLMSTVATPLKIFGMGVRYPNRRGGGVPFWWEQPRKSAENAANPGGWGDSPERAVGGLR